MNSAPTSTISPAALKNARISHSTECTGLRDEDRSHNMHERLVDDVAERSFVAAIVYMAYIMLNMLWTRVSAAIAVGEHDRNDHGQKQDKATRLRR